MYDKYMHMYMPVEFIAIIWCVDLLDTTEEEVI